MSVKQLLSCFPDISYLIIKNMDSINKISPLLSPGYWILGIILIISGLIILMLSLFYEKLNIDVVFLILCFGLFCIGYRKEKNESEEIEKITLRRYHSLRLALSFTTVIVITVSSAIVFSDNTLKFNGLHFLFVYLVLFNLINLIIKKRKNE